ncbi:winged helix-turn-helix domain-containing protein [Natrinema sp. 1APR25-10V2]|uniref:winged helix-turn-helix domain-containing protein n=1 Tax=Natrinema sp. 1APR25-10V2 TaxID=2951081 RepID=UPI00287586E8|nr:winged helix-turn-helix domain-containing protein [Natrinema sp. 1APR25-10V2]MDS0477169.1 winged helix-turn-helix domain-containing protein [Natrinema sp. 1APR25-10V2]
MASDPSERVQAATDAESAFMTLSHDLRLEILLALWDAPGFSLSFSELRKTVGERDSGSFTYHLSELQDHFVAKTDEGYELQYPGHRVLDAIQSGVFHEQVAVGPVELDEHCRSCGGRLTFTYDTDYIARIRCADCGNRALEWPFDPGGIADRDDDAIVAAFDRRTRLVWSCALEGVCPFCAGRIDRELTRRVHEEGACIGVIEQLDRYDEYFARDHPAVVAVDCDRCSFYSFVPVGVVLLTRPAVTGRLHDAGLEVRETPLWDLGFVVDAGAVSVRETDPLCVEVSVVDAPESLGFTVGDSFEVVDETTTEI